MVLGAGFRHVPDPADYALVSALSARSRPAAPGFCLKSPKRVNGPFTGQQGGVENRVYHGGMAPDTITLPRPPTPAAWPELSTTEQPASVVTTVLVAPTAAESESAAPPNPQQPPDLDLLGDRIAELSARIQAATYELLCYLREFDRQHGWEGFRSVPTGSTGAPASTSAPRARSCASRPRWPISTTSPRPWPAGGFPTPSYVP